MSTNQVRNLGLLWPWNGDRLKNGNKKKCVLHEIIPFLRSYHNYFIGVLYLECLRYSSVHNWNKSTHYKAIQVSTGSIVNATIAGHLAIHNGPTYHIKPSASVSRSREKSLDLGTLHLL